MSFDPAVLTQPEKMAEMRKLIGNLTPDMLLGDVAACLDVLASRADVDASRVGAVGYCMGGRNAFLAATRFPDRLRATASIHPGGIVTADPSSPHLLAGPVKARMYFGIAKDDMFFTREQAETLDRTLAALGKRYQIEHYEARHGWAVNDTPVYDAAEAERHWKAILALFAEELRSLVARSTSCTIWMRRPYAIRASDSAIVGLRPAATSLRRIWWKRASTVLALASSAMRAT